MQIRKSVPYLYSYKRVISWKQLAENHKMVSKEYHFFKIVTKGFTKIGQKSLVKYTLKILVVK